MTSTPVRPVHTAVLVEGDSDRQAVLATALAEGRNLVADGIVVVAMGGATNIERALRSYGPDGRDLTLVGLCDEPERRYFERCLDADDIFVCNADLEDELIRAIGVREMVDFIEEQGELKTFRIFQKQPAQRDRTLAQHVHRFCGIRAGRKIRYARGMVEWLPADQLPSPLRDLVASL